MFPDQGLLPFSGYTAFKAITLHLFTFQTVHLVQKVLVDNNLVAITKMLQIHEQKLVLRAAARSLCLLQIFFRDVFRVGQGYGRDLSYKKTVFKL